MQIILSLSAALLALAAISTQPTHTAAQELLVEPVDVNVTTYNSAIVVTSLADARNYANEHTQPICVKSVTRVREAVYNATRDLYIEVTGCSVDKPQGKCKTNAKCNVPFEVHVVGPETTPDFDPVATMAKGKSVKSPYVIQSIGLLL